MRVLVWNMNKQKRAWDYLRGHAKEFDVALLQETRDPRLMADPRWSSVVWRPKAGPPGSRRTLWGSAVIAPSLELEGYEPNEAFPWLGELAGSVAVARSSGSPTWFASLHTHASPVPQAVLDLHSWADAPLCAPNGTVWEQDLIPFELHRLFAGETFLWGGDLNSAEAMDDLGFVGGNRRLREIWREAGSRDLRGRFCTEEQQTFFRPNRRPYQLDHVFADPLTESRVLDWRVDTPAIAATPAFSDHAPIVVELERCN